MSCPLIYRPWSVGWRVSHDLEPYSAALVPGTLQRTRSNSTATLTAFVTTNFRELPGLVAWLGPSVLVVPLIVVWRAKVLGGHRAGARN